MLLDEKGRVAGFIDTAEGHLRELCGACDEQIRDNGWARELLRQLEQSPNFRRGLPVPTKALSRRGGKPLIAYMWSFPWADNENHQPVLILIDLERPTEPGEAVLSQLFGLTGAEAKLAARMAGGRSLEEIASELGITMGTARSQLRSIFAKTHTHRQAELVALLNRAGLLRVDGRPLEFSDLGELLRRRA